MRGSDVVSDEAAEMNTVAKIATLIFDPKAQGSLVRLVSALISNAANARDRLSDDTWIFFNQLRSIVDNASRIPRASDLLRMLDRVVLHLAAFSGMQAENMIRGQGWRFLEIGRRIERAWCGLAMLSKASEGESFLEPLIEVCDSVMTYRRRHFSRPDWAGVIELLYLDKANPRGIAFQIAILHREFHLFPGDPDFGLLPKIFAEIDRMFSNYPKEAPANADELMQLRRDLEALSDLVTQHYFSHSVRRVY